MNEVSRKEAAGRGDDRPACYRVCDLPARLRPREAIERQGVEHVPDAALLAVLLRSGAAGMNVVELAESILKHYGTLTALARVPVEELAANRKFKGLGKVKAQTLKAALELARRMSDEAREAGPGFVRSPDDAAGILRASARVLDHERFWTLHLDTRNRVKGGPQEVSRGILDASLVHPREVFKPAIQSGCAALVLVHNHPSGDPTPSAEDVRITRQIVQAGQVVGIKVLDHVVLGRASAERDRDFVSMRESGMVEFVN